MSSNQALTEISLPQLSNLAEDLRLEVKEASLSDLHFVERFDRFLNVMIGFCKESSKVTVLYRSSYLSSANQSLEQHLISSIEDQAQLIRALFRQLVLDTNPHSRNNILLRNRISTLLFCLRNSIVDLYHEYHKWNTLPLFDFFQRVSPRSE